MSRLPIRLASWLLAALAAAAAGCASSVPVVVREPVEVKIPIMEPCVSAMPESPALITDRDLAALGDYAAVKALQRDRMQRAGYQAVLEAALRRCSTKTMSFESP